jgi:hypothetical protein
VELGTYQVYGLVGCAGCVVFDGPVVLIAVILKRSATRLSRVWSCKVRRMVPQTCEQHILKTTPTGSDRLLTYKGT